ncbi:MAG TPA: hypothetical protein VJ327_09795 [Patescibacteria group bacterium]|nr:MAG: hypothetical protein A2899_02910 [Candidatus Amesbacteria bacterium RIFCSPLOWO2_01_FULL_49_25]HJZ06118.1 hypothetical protein [Patescibacteria group bacterium]
MGCLGRLIGLIAHLTFTVLGRLLVLFLRLLQHIVAILIGLLFNLMRLSLQATIIGPKQFVERRAADWTRQLLMTGMSNDHFDIAHRVSRIIVGGMVVMGWVLIVAGTVLIVVAIVRIVT